MHAEETHVDAVNLLERKHGTGAIRKRLLHLASVHESLRDNKQ